MFQGCSGLFRAVPVVFRGCSGGVPGVFRGVFRVLQTPLIFCKNGDVTRGKLSLQHVPATCPRLCAGLKVFALPEFRFQKKNRSTFSRFVKRRLFYLYLLFISTENI